MKTRCLLCLLSSFLVCISAFSRPKDHPSPAQAKAAFEAEQTLIEQARDATRRGDPKLVDEILVSDDGLAGQVPSTVLFARRAVGVCSWLRNNDDYAGSIRVARRAVARLKGEREDNDADRAERLYWEAVLCGDFLDQKETALSLLLKAEQLAPGDDRILESSLQLAEALSSFGK